MGAYNSRLARRIVVRATTGSVDPSKDEVRAQLAELVDRQWDEALRLVGDYGVLPQRAAAPEYEVTTAREIGLRYIADRALQRRFRSELADEHSWMPALPRHWARQPMWFAGGVLRGRKVAQQLPVLSGEYVLTANTVLVNTDCEDFYRPTRQAGYALAGNAAAQVRAVLIHEIAHANLAAAAPSLARIPGMERSARLQMVLEGYPTWVGRRVADRIDPESGKLVDPALHEWQAYRYGSDHRGGVFPLEDPYGNGADWLEEIHQRFGDKGVQAVVSLREDQLPHTWQWHDVGRWGDATLGVPRRNDAPVELVSPRHGRHRVPRERQPGRHHRHGKGS